jgi:hypothetical protein
MQDGYPADALLSAGGKEAMQKRASGLEAHHLFNRQYRCFMTYLASYTMEDVSRLLQCHAAQLMWSDSTGHVVHPLLIELLGKLRRVAEFHMSRIHYDTEAAFKQALVDATRLLHEYAKAVEGVRTFLISKPLAH